MSDVDHQTFPATSGRDSPAALVRPRTGDLLHISGIPGFDENGGLPDAFDAQFANVVTNIKRVLNEAGATFRDLVVNVLMPKHLARRLNPPAVVALPNRKMLIEIEGVAQLAR